MYIIIRGALKYCMLKIFILSISSILLASNSLVYALKHKTYKTSKDVIITAPKKLFKKEKVYDLDMLLLKQKIKKPMHSLNEGVSKFQKNKRVIEKDLSKNIKKLFLLPKDIKVKSILDRDRIKTEFIYIFKK